MASQIGAPWGSNVTSDVIEPWTYSRSNVASPEAPEQSIENGSWRLPPGCAASIVPVNVPSPEQAITIRTRPPSSRPTPEKDWADSPVIQFGPNPVGIAQPP